MNLTYTRPGELRKPDVEVLPDGRIRITRYIAAGHGDRDLAEVTESVGTADKGVATARLIKRGMTQVAGKDAIVKTYEVINASSETQVGLPDVQYTESGQKTMVYDFIQMSSGTYTPGTIGTTAAPGDANCILQTEQVQDDGTTRQIRRVFINKGLLQQTDETKNNGALLLKTLVYLNDAPIPNPPTGYTLVSQQTQNPSGLETTTYTYAKGSGEISREIDYSNSGNQGSTGITRTTIRYLVAPGAAVQPASLTGSVEVGRSFQDLDGHRIWTTTWAKGTGEISRETRYGQSGNEGSTGTTLITIQHLTDAVITTNPISTPTDTVLVSIESSVQNGYKVWSGTYAKGIGEISRSIEYSNSGNQGTNGLTRTTIRHLVAAAGTVQPTALAGSVEVSRSFEDANGYRIWTTVWAKGTGEISRASDFNNSGNQGTTGLTRTTIRYLVAIGASVQPTFVTDFVEVARNFEDADGYRIWTTTWAKGTGQISYETRYVQSLDQGTTGATVITIRHLTAISITTNPITTPTGTVLISEDRSDQDGYRVWTAVYAKGGSGVVASSNDTQNGGKLVIYRRTTIGVAPTAPTATIGGTVNPLSQTSRTDSGYTIYEYTWAEGIGIVAERIQYREGGLRLLNREIFVNLGVTVYSAYTPANGIEVDKSFTEGDGIRRYSVTWIQSNNGGDPLAASVLQFVTKVPFTYPGRAKAYYSSFTTGSYVSHRAYDVYLSPPVEAMIDAVTNIYYTSNTTTMTLPVGYTLWNPTQWATMRAKWIGWANSPRSKVEGLKGYIAENTGLSGTSGGAGLDTSVLGDRVYAGTDWSITLSGGPSSPALQNLVLSLQKVPAFTSTSGVQYYRVTEVYATPPAQAALPV